MIRPLEEASGRVNSLQGNSFEFFFFAVAMTINTGPRIAPMTTMYIVAAC